MKKLAVLGDFLEPHHHAQIDSTAARCGFAADYYPDGHVPAELAGQYEVLYGMPDRAALRTFTSLKWFCGNFAGVDAYLDDALYPSPDVILTNSSGAYGVTIAEHLIMVTLMLLRHASAYVLEAAAHRWGPVLPMRSIMGSTITVVGTGDIGTEFARRAKAMGAKSIRGVRRTMKPADPAFDSVHTHDQLESLLPDTDLLVLALPSTPDTIGFLSRRRIALLPKTAFVINVGRGSAIDQPALVDALNAGQLAGAALDVFVQEPIPDGDPIWDAKNLLLTPHVSGQLSLGYTRDKNVALFCEDLENYAAGRPLARYVDRKIGY
jgi:D-isomer specific 2-hydroxyacid dehydrogenase, NAD-binding